MRVRILQSQDQPADATAAVFSATGERFIVAARTDVGRRRSNNEDNYLVTPELGLFVLSDGMGGEAAGELASKIAVEEITRHMQEAARTNEGWAAPPPDADSHFAAATNHLGSAIRRANRAIWEASQHHASHRGMGATVVTALMRGPIFSIAHVGDSRIYLIRNGEIQRLTQDHSLVMEHIRRGLITPEEAEHNEMKHIIMRALGADEAVEVDLDEVFTMPGDHLVLCSDGLTGMLRDEGIAQVVSEAPSPQQACDRLVEIANDNGGEDNVTVIVVRVTEPPRRGFWAWLKNLLG